MLVMRTTEDPTDPVGKLVSAQQTLWLRAGDHGAYEPVSEAQTHGTERGLQERCVDDQDLQCKRQQERTLQPRVAKQPVERAALVRTGVGGVEELEQDQRGEGHR